MKLWNPPRKESKAENGVLKPENSTSRSVLVLHHIISLRMHFRCSYYLLPTILKSSFVSTLCKKDRCIANATMSKHLNTHITGCTLQSNGNWFIWSKTSLRYSRCFLVHQWLVMKIRLITFCKIILPKWAVKDDLMNFSPL